VSVKATNFVRRLRGLTITEKAVAMILADHDSHKGDGSFPGMTTVADESCLKNRQTATDVVKRLVAKGVITTDSLSRGGRGKTTVYRFNYALTNCNPEVTVASDNCNSRIAVSTPNTATLTPVNCNPVEAKLQPWNPETATGELHEGVEGFMKGKEKGESKTEKPSLALNSSEGGQEKKLADFIVKIAKGTNTDAAFDQKSKRALSLELSAITPPPTETELRNAVSSQVAAMDSFALQNAGSRIASSLVGAIAAIRDAAKAVQDRKDDKQTIKRSEIARDDWRKKLDEANDIDQYVQDNPPPEWFVEYEGGKKSFPYADEYIDEARKSLSRRNALQLIEAVF
jgi:hypothetical protein